MTHSFKGAYCPDMKNPKKGDELFVVTIPLDGGELLRLKLGRTDVDDLKAKLSFEEPCER